MNNYQKLWWDQAISDYSVFVLLREQSASQCHLLHYLQMATEKLFKAYLYASSKEPARSHKGILSLLKRFALIRKKSDQQRIAKIFSFNEFKDFKNWILLVSPIAHGLENLVPSLANGPNTEYPWPHKEPEFAPVNYEFPEWKSLASNHGRDFIRIIKIAIEKFPEYADI